MGGLEYVWVWDRSWYWNGDGEFVETKINGNGVFLESSSMSILHKFSDREEVTVETRHKNSSM